MDIKKEAEEILELASKATAGPWVIYGPYPNANIGVERSDAESQPELICSIDTPADALGLADVTMHPNAAFIASAHRMADLIRELLPDALRYRIVRTLGMEFHDIAHLKDDKFDRVIDEAMKGG